MSTATSRTVPTHPPHGAAPAAGPLWSIWWLQPTALTLNVMAQLRSPADWLNLPVLLWQQQLDWVQSQLQGPWSQAWLQWQDGEAQWADLWSQQALGLGLQLAKPWDCEAPLSPPC